MGNFIVYIHKNKFDGKIYVGITCQKVNRRWRNGEAYRCNRHFYSAIQKYGWESFEHIIFKAGLTKTEACEEECRLIRLYKTNDERYGYNLSTGGECSAAGMVVSEESRQKHREALLGKKRPQKVRQKISASKKGKSNGKTGYLGKKSGNSKHVYQLDLNGNIINDFYGCNEAARELGYSSPSIIGEVCRGKRKTAYGYKWKYEEG